MFESVLGETGGAVVQFVLALIVVIVLIVAVAWAIKRFGGAQFGASQSGKAELEIVDAIVVDQRRRLVVVRHGRLEHLLLIGGGSDVVVERSMIGGVPLAARLGAQKAARPGSAAAPAPALPGDTPAAPKASATPVEPLTTLSTSTSPASAKSSPSLAKPAADEKASAAAASTGLAAAAATTGLAAAVSSAVKSPPPLSSRFKTQAPTKLEPEADSTPVAEEPKPEPSTPAASAPPALSFDDDALARDLEAALQAERSDSPAELGTPAPEASPPSKSAEVTEATEPVAAAESSASEAPQTDFSVRPDPVPVSIPSRGPAAGAVTVNTAESGTTETAKAPEPSDTAATSSDLPGATKGDPLLDISDLLAPPPDQSGSDGGDGDQSDDLDAEMRRLLGEIAGGPKKT
ncbi:MAG: flagellar biosynthetic protein FliO [Devosiaceae bacterium]|nr:flagellar biosynthetic protein FliO [Devosiaceae bacterium MH13]